MANGELAPSSGLRFDNRFSSYANQLDPSPASGGENLGAECMSPNSLNINAWPHAVGMALHQIYRTNNKQCMDAASQSFPLMDQDTRCMPELTLHISQDLSLGRNPEPSKEIGPEAHRPATGSAFGTDNLSMSPTIPVKRAIVDSSAGTRSKRTRSSSERSEETIQKERREKNRVAASKSRVKKGNRIRRMEEHAREASLFNAELRKMALALRRETIELKEAVLRNSSCRCPEIQQYCNDEVQNFVTTSSLEDRRMEKNALALSQLSPDYTSS